MLRLSLLLLLACCLVSGAALALDSRIALADYRHDSWSSKDGAPGEVNCMAQTADGWIWLGTGSGLYRFDGVRFERFVPQGNEQLQKRAISALRALKNGALLVGYLAGGVDQLVDGRVLHYPPRPDGKQFGPVYSLDVDSDGTPLVASTDGLLRFHQGRWHDFGQLGGLPAGPTTNLTIDQHGQIWVESNGRLFVYARAARRFQEVMYAPKLVNLIASPDGRLWADSHGQLQLVPQPFQPPAKPRTAWMNTSNGQENGLFDRDGNFWALQCPAPICRTRALGQAPTSVVESPVEPEDRLDQGHRLSSLATSILLEDREGNIWVGTQNGLERFRHNNVLPVAIDTAERFFVLARDGGGAVWAKGIIRGSLFRLTPSGRVASAEPGLAHDALASGRDGSLLVARGCDIERRNGARRDIVSLPAALRQRPGCTILKIVDDGEALWVNVSGQGTYRLAGGDWAPASAFGIAGIMPFIAAGARGEAWLADRNGNTFRYADGKAARLQGTPIAGHGALTLLDANEQLVGTDKALLVRHGPGFAPIRVQDNAVLAAVSGIVVDDDGDRWINGSCGVVRIAKADWQSALAKPELPVSYQLFDALEGYPGEASTPLRVPTAIKDGAGQLWFVGTAGVARLDPRAIHRNTQPPSSAITAVFAGAERYPPAGKLSLPPKTNSIRIEYAALSYTMPEKVVFRHFLEGLDTQWQDGGGRRASEYTNLDPGSYRFRLKAINEAGIESLDEAVFAFEIAPTLVQTTAFKAACGAALLLLLYAAHRYRMYLAASRLAEKMHVQAAERERIARTLHDTILQDMQGLILLVGQVAYTLPEASPARAAIDAIADQTTDSLIEGRDQIVALRNGHQIDWLDNAFAAIVQRLQAHHSARFEVKVTGPACAMASPAKEEIFSIGREALFNAFRHACASHITVELDYTPGQFTLCVRDDGVGIEDAYADGGVRSGHWGLSGMRERADLLQASLTLERLPAGGTNVRLQVPARYAYALAHAGPTRFLARLRTRWASRKPC
jgi:signal transduction histidine kinase/ligand-binding sensor domain-containing protein